MKTSWQPVSKWYNTTVGDKGNYYHQHVVIPGVIRLLSLDTKSSLIDLGCGQGVLARAIPGNIPYTGIDAAPSLISEAKNQDKNTKHKYLVADLTKPLSNMSSTHAAIILALQNIEFPDLVIKNAARSLTPNGKLVIVLNHPAFRIPRQSSWEIDPQNKLQYRRVNRYLSALKVPITAHPSQTTSPLTWSFHQPISVYFKYLNQAGFVITALEEWSSDKESVGTASKMENRARAEFPLFMAIVCQKLTIPTTTA